MESRQRINLASTRLAFYLIALVTLQMLVSAIVPQQNIAEDQLMGWQRFVGDDNDVVRILWLDRIYFSPVFYVSLVLLGINLIAGNVQRLRKVRQAKKTLTRVRHLGSIVFHLALLVVIAGVLLNSITRFDRVFGMTEGQIKSDHPEAYFRSFDGQLATEPQGEFNLELVSVNPEHLVKGSATEAARIYLIPTDGSPAVLDMVYINHPLSWRNLEFHLGATAGYSPEVVVLDSAGRELFKKFIRMKVDFQEGRKIYEDYVVLPEDDLRLKIEIRPQAGRPEIQGRYLDLEKAGTKLFQGEIAIGETIDVGDYRITVPEVRRWCYVHVIRNPWLWLVFAGFWLCLAGLTVSIIPRAFGQRS